MPSQRILLLGDGDLTDETDEALRAADADVTRLADPSHDELRDALQAGADAVLVVSNHDAWPLRVALLVRHIDRDVPIVATIFDPETGRELEALIGNCTITSLADIVAPTLAGPCLSDTLCAVVDGDRPVGLRCRDGAVEEANLPEARSAGPGRWPPPSPARSTAAQGSSSSARSACWSCSSPRRSPPRSSSSRASSTPSTAGSRHSSRSTRTPRSRTARRGSRSRSR
jgi:hypothetical protein